MRLRRRTAAMVAVLMPLALAAVTGCGSATPDVATLHGKGKVSNAADSNAGATQLEGAEKMVSCLAENGIKAGLEPWDTTQSAVVPEVDDTYLLCTPDTGCQVSKGGPIEDQWDMTETEWERLYDLYSDQQDAWWSAQDAVTEAWTGAVTVEGGGAVRFEVDPEATVSGETTESLASADATIVGEVIMDDEAPTAGEDGTITGGDGETITQDAGETPTEGDGDGVATPAPEPDEVIGEEIIDDPMANLPPLLIVGSEDMSSIWIACQEESGYTYPQWQYDPQDELRSKQAQADAGADWAACARENGLPEVKDPDPPVADEYQTYPSVKIPATIAYELLEAVIDACPVFDIEAQRAWDEAYEAAYLEIGDDQAAWEDWFEKNPYPEQPPVELEYPENGFDSPEEWEELDKLQQLLYRDQEAYWNEQAGGDVAFVEELPAEGVG
ncbi:MAG: hypothetical protein LBR19_00205 [Bifidobacteriaceae bacterium]|nr:hypothetical protein [Bifidobacteriaceae bacterium]